MPAFPGRGPAPAAASWAAGGWGLGAAPRGGAGFRGLRGRGAGRGGAPGFGGARPRAHPEAAPARAQGCHPGAPGSVAAPVPGAAANRRGRGGLGRGASGAARLAQGALVKLHVAPAAPGPLGSLPRAEVAGGSPEPHVFHCALCLERTSRRLSPWKQNRGGGGAGAEARLGPEWGQGRCGSRAVACGTRSPASSRSSPPGHPGRGLFPRYPGLTDSHPRPCPPVFGPGPRCGFPFFLIPSFRPVPDGRPHSSQELETMEEWAHVRDPAHRNKKYLLCHSSKSHVMGILWVLQQARVGQVPCSLSFSRQLPRKPRAGVSAFSERGFQRTVAFGSALS